MTFSTTEGVPPGYRLVRHHWLCWSYESPNSTNVFDPVRFTYFTAAGVTKAAHRHLELVKEYEEVLKTK